MSSSYIDCVLFSHSEACTPHRDRLEVDPFFLYCISYFVSSFFLLHCVVSDPAQQLVSEQDDVRA